MIPEIKLGYLFILNHEDQINALRENLIKIRNDEPLWIGISNLIPDYNQRIASMIENILPNVKYNIISNFEDISNLYKLDQFLKNYKNGWTLVNIVGENFNTNAKTILKKYINEKEQKFCLIVENKDAEIPNVNNMCYFNFTYAYVKGNIPEYLEEEDSLITKSILDKVRESNPEMIRSWSELL